jgi:hypothetical protein
MDASPTPLPDTNAKMQGANGFKATQSVYGLHSYESSFKDRRNRLVKKEKSAPDAESEESVSLDQAIIQQHITPTKFTNEAPKRLWKWSSKEEEQEVHGFRETNHQPEMSEEVNRGWHWGSVLDNGLVPWRGHQDLDKPTFEPDFIPPAPYFLTKTPSPGSSNRAGELQPGWQVEAVPGKPTGNIFPGTVWNRPEKPAYVHAVSSIREAKRVAALLEGLIRADKQIAGEKHDLERQYWSRRIFACDTEVRAPQAFSPKFGLLACRTCGCQCMSRCVVREIILSRTYSALK